MTADSKDISLVERVAVAMWDTWNRVMVDYGLHKQSNGDFHDPEPADAIQAEAHRLLRKAALDEAEAALDACHAQEMLTALNRLTQATGTLLNVYLADEEDEIELCQDVDHHLAILELRAAFNEATKVEIQLARDEGKK